MITVRKRFLNQNQNSYGKVTIRAGMGWISYILGSNTAKCQTAILPNMEGTVQSTQTLKFVFGHKLRRMRGSDKFRIEF